MLKKLSLISTIIFITASCHAAANGVDDEYLQQAVAHLQQTKRNHSLRAVEIARRDLIGSLLINHDVWHQDPSMTAEEKYALDFGFSDNNIRKQINAGRLDQLMDPRQPWHAGSFIEWVAVKRLLAQVATADLRTFQKYSKDMWQPKVMIPALSASALTGLYCSPLVAGSIGCCHMCALCAFITVQLAQEQDRGEYIFKAVDWLGCSKAWQRHIASAMPQPMTMDDVVDITARVYEYPPKPKRD